MVCRLPTPHWTIKTQVGLQSAVENIVDGYIVLDIAEAIPVFPGEFNYYNIYWATSLSDLFNYPKAVTTQTQVSVPNDIVSLNYYFAVRTAQMGVSGSITAGNMLKLNTDLYSFPGSSELKAGLNPSSTFILIEDATGWPSADGYVQVNDEIILYSSIVDGYDGLYDALIIADRDPFGCNTITSHPDGYDVSLFRGFEDLNNTRFRPLASCGMPEPEWEHVSNKGIRRVSDLGIGTSAKVEWYDAKPPQGFSRIYFNVYQNEKLINLFNSQPVGFSTSLEAVVPDLNPGRSYYFGIRAGYQLSNLDLPNFAQTSDNFYKYPDPVEVDEPDGFLYSDQLGWVIVNSTAGFPLRGYLGIASEILEYDGITATSFNIIDRDLFSLNLISDYPNGAKIHFFKGVEERNFQFFRVVPTWDSGAEVPRMPIPDGYLDGYVDLNYNQDADGYRHVFDDIVTEDYESFEEENDDFSVFPYCGYRQQNPVKLHMGEQCGTYHGGRTFGLVPGMSSPVPITTGPNTWESAQQRNEVILGLTAEPFVLIRRKTTGRKCPRLSIRSEHPHARCGTCYGTTFLGGYDRFSNSRELRPGEANPNGFINIRISPYDNDLELTSDRGLAQVDILDGWTIAIPIIKDRDILIKYMFDEVTGLFVEEYRYEVLKVTRNKLLFGQPGQQKFTMKKLDKTDEVYKYPVALV